MFVRDVIRPALIFIAKYIAKVPVSINYVRRFGQLFIYVTSQTSAQYINDNK